MRFALHFKVTIQKGSALDTLEAVHVIFDTQTLHVSLFDGFIAVCTTVEISHVAIRTDVSSIHLPNV
jgi:hypothetical protein